MKRYGASIAALFSLFFSLTVLSAVAAVQVGDWWGVVTIADSQAPDGTVVTAFVNGDEVMSVSVGAIEPGYYLVHVEGSEGDIVTFKINGVDAEQGAQVWSSGDHRLDLSAGAAAATTTTVAPAEVPPGEGEEATTTTAPTEATTTLPTEATTTTTLPQLPLGLPELPTMLAIAGQQIPTLWVVLAVVVVVLLLILIFKREKIFGKAKKNPRI